MEASPDLLAPFLAPVSADAPAGEDLTYDEAYLRIREEVDRIGTVSVHVDHERSADGEGGAPGAGVDYAGLADEVRSLLEGRTRDLQLAAYLTVSLARARGAEGLAEGLEVTRALAETFGEAVHPIKPLRRRNALQFLAERAKDWITEEKFATGDAGALDRAGAAAEALQGWATTTMGEDAPALSGLRQAIDEGRARASRAAKAAESKAATAAASTAAAPAGGPLELASVSDARRIVLRACAFLREQDPANPQPYRLARALAWGALIAPPPNEQGKTHLDPPDSATATRLEALTTGSEPPAVLREIEEAFATRPFWLDLQRHAAQAAERGGPSLAGVHRAIVSDTSELVRRLPELTSLSFSDGRPLADPATQSWLDSARSDHSGGASAPSAGDPFEGARDEALALAAQGDLNGAIRLLQEAPVGDRTGRDRYLRRLHVARLCAQSGRHAVATALLDALGDEIDRRALEEWEPSLALEVWRAAHAAWTAVAAGASGVEKESASARQSAAHARVSRLDPAAGLALSGARDKKGGQG